MRKLEKNKGQGSSNDPRGSSLGCLVVIGSGGVLESGFCHTSCLLGFRLVALYQQKIAINEFSVDDLPLPCAGLNNMKVQEK